jgi:hypothetical protein
MISRIQYLPPGKKWRCHRVVSNAREQAAIEKAWRLREQGLSYEKIAAVLNTMGIRTRSGRASWYAKTERDLLVASTRALSLEAQKETRSLNRKSLDTWEKSVAALITLDSNFRIQGSARTQ